MDGDFRIDLDDLLKNVNTADVVSIYFPVLRKTILIDTRFTAEDPPMIRIVPMAGSLEERQRSLRKLRPQFPRPNSITVVPWPKYVTAWSSSEYGRRCLSGSPTRGTKRLYRRATMCCKRCTGWRRTSLAP